MARYHFFLTILQYLFVSTSLVSVYGYDEQPCPKGYHLSDVLCRMSCTKDCSESTTYSINPKCKWRCPYAPTFTDFQLSCDKGFYHDSKVCEQHCTDPCRHLTSRDLSNCNYQCPNHRNVYMLLLVFVLVFILILSMTCFVCFVHPACPCRQRMMARKGGNGQPAIAPGHSTPVRPYMEHEGPAVATKPHPNDNNEGPDRLPALAVPLEPNLVDRTPPKLHTYGYL